MTKFMFIRIWIILVSLYLCYINLSSVYIQKRNFLLKKDYQPWKILVK